MEVLILGCGYTGRRVARRLRARGLHVIATTRDPARLADLQAAGVEVLPWTVGDLLPSDLPDRLRVLHSVPVLDLPAGPVDPTPRLLDSLGTRPARMVYLSTTGVYGAQAEVDEHTPPAPATERQRLRTDAEAAVSQGPWTSMVLRPAAIYGPGRGIHVALREGRYRLAGDGSNWTSRIHVDDLAALAEAALVSDHEGAFPVADERPATAREVASFVADRIGCAMPVSVDPSEVHETLRTTRKVDGSAIRRLLGVTLRYPDYESGIRASH